MASMSYCCIENCVDNLAQSIEKFKERQDNVQSNPYELGCIEALYELCKEYVEEYEDYLDDKEKYIKDHSERWDEDDDDEDDEDFEDEDEDEEEIQSTSPLYQPSEDEILIVDSDIFGDEEEHELTMLFEDGQAYDVNGEYVLVYPLMDEVLASEEMQLEILTYCGRKVGSFYDIALKYGVLYNK